MGKYLGRYSGYGKGTKGSTSGGGRSGSYAISKKSSGGSRSSGGGSSSSKKKAPEPTVIAGWTQIGKSGTGTPVWQKGGEVIATTKPKTTTRGIAPKTVGPVYFSPVKGWRPTDKPDATVVYITPSGKTTGEVSMRMETSKDPYAPKLTDKFALGVFKGIDIANPTVGKKQLEEAFYITDVFSIAKAKQDTRTVQKFHKAQAIQQKGARQKAIKSAVAGIQAEYARRLSELSRTHYKFSSDKWSKMSPIQRNYYEQKYMLAIDKQKTIRATQKRLQGSKPKARYAHTLKQRLAVLKPGVESIRGTSLKQRLTGKKL